MRREGGYFFHGAEEGGAYQTGQERIEGRRC